MKLIITYGNKELDLSNYCNYETLLDDVGRNLSREEFEIDILDATDIINECIKEIFSPKHFHQISNSLKNIAKFYFNVLEEQNDLETIEIGCVYVSHKIINGDICSEDDLWACFENGCEEYLASNIMDAFEMIIETQFGTFPYTELLEYRFDYERYVRDCCLVVSHYDNYYIYLE